MIDREDSDGIAVLTLNHGKASALDVELTEAIRRELAASSDSRAVILTGTGTIFCAGVDLFRVLDGGRAYVERFLPSLRDAIRDLFTFPKPLVVAANGHAIAGGAILVATGDHRLVASGSGRIGVPELIVGVPFPAWALEIVRHGVAPMHLQEVVYTGKTYTPEEAKAIGLVDEVVEPEELVERARDVAERLAAIPPAAFALAKRQIRSPAVERADALSAVADAEMLSIWSAPETHEHIRGHLQRTIGKRS